MKQLINSIKAILEKVEIKYYLDSFEDGEVMIFTTGYLNEEERIAVKIHIAIEETSLQMTSQLMTGIPENANSYTLMNDLNRAHPFFKFMLRNESVFMRYDFPKAFLSPNIDPILLETVLLSAFVDAYDCVDQAYPLLIDLIPEDEE